MYVAELFGGTTEQAIRWLILAMRSACDRADSGGFGAAVGSAMRLGAAFWPNWSRFVPRLFEQLAADPV
jgi:hypothetical protein